MKLTELFNSFQGEGVYTGYPMTFIRVAGCPVGCPFCDTNYEYGEKRTFEEITQQIQHRHVCLTGGEPLAHPQIEDLIEEIMQHPTVRKVHIETSGCYELPHIIFQARPFFWITVSPKGSFLGAKKEFRESVLTDADEIKWIYPGSPEHLIENSTRTCENVYIQPINSRLSIDDKHLAASEQVARKLNLPLSIQTHKLLNWR